MFKFITLTALTLTLTLAQTALANLNCSAGNGDTLSVEFNTLSPDGKKSDVKATLSTQAGVQIFAGNQQEQVPGTYSLKDAQGNNAGLEIRTQAHYGGRCGRCGNFFESTNALLTLPQADLMIFECN